MAVGQSLVDTQWRRVETTLPSGEDTRVPEKRAEAIRAP